MLYWKYLLQKAGFTDLLRSMARRERYNLKMTVVRDGKSALLEVYTSESWLYRSRRERYNLKMTAVRDGKSALLEVDTSESWLY